MPQSNLLNVLVALKTALNETEQLVVATGQWASARFPPGIPKFTPRYKEIIVRLAFLQTFLAWEEFIDESFTLYLLGMKPPRGRRPHRLHTPSKRKDAERFILGADDYADWSKIHKVRERAKKYFRRGEPFDPALSAHQNMFDEMNTIRNAIAHSSKYSQKKFKSLVRRRLGTYPTGLTIGKFLTMNNPRSSYSETFIEYYLNRVIFVAENIVPN